MQHSVIQLAVSRRCFPRQSSAEAAALAKAMGFDGIAVEDEFDISEPIAAVYTGLGFAGSAQQDTASANEIRKLVERAEKLNCKIVQLPDIAVTAKFKTVPSPLAIGDWLLTIADHAADHNVTLAIINGSAVRTAKMMWNLLERADHPSIACCWDVDAAMRWGEGPSVSVPTLGSRIVAARVHTAGIFTQQFVVRLRGIGFGGWVIVNHPTIATETAVATLRGWIKPKAVAGKAVKKAVPAKTVG